MQFITMITMMIVFIISAVDTIVATTVTVTYTDIYDNPETSLYSVSCSTGSNGLINKGFMTFGDVIDFPNIAGSSIVTGWNSPNCVSCFQLTWPNNGKSIYVLVIDTAAEGFNLSEEAMNDLTGGEAVKLGRINNVNAIEVDRTHCGIYW